MRYTNLGRKGNVYIGKLDYEINTKDLFSLELTARLKSDQ